MHRALIHAKFYKDSRHGLLWALGTYLRRYLRLIPIIGFVLLYVVYILPLQGNGPLWELGLGRLEVQECRTSFWSNLLLINNLTPDQLATTSNSGLGCLSWTWVIATDAQLFLLVPLFANVYWRFVDHFHIVMFFFIVATVSTIATLSAKYKLSVCEPVFSGFEAPASMLTLIYNKPWTRGIPFYCGVWLAGFYDRAGGAANHKIYPLPSRGLRVLLFITAACAILFPIYLPALAFGDDGGCRWSEAGNTAFLALRHVSFSLGLTVVAMSCLFEWGGVLVWFSSSKLWTVTGRLSLLCFLFGPIILIVNIYSSYTDWEYTSLTLTSVWTAAVFFTLVCGTCLFFFIDQPVRNFLRAF